MSNDQSAVTVSAAEPATTTTTSSPTQSIIERLALEQPDEFIRVLNHLLQTPHTDSNHDDSNSNHDQLSLLRQQLLTFIQQQQQHPPLPRVTVRRGDDEKDNEDDAEEIDKSSSTTDLISNPSRASSAHHHQSRHHIRNSSRASSPFSTTTASHHRHQQQFSQSIDADEWLRRRWAQQQRHLHRHKQSVARCSKAETTEADDELDEENVDVDDDDDDDRSSEKAAEETFENHKQRLRKLRMSQDVLTQDLLLRELIIDVAKELDVDMLCCKVLQNVLALVDGDRGSLFLATSNAAGVAGPALVSQLFDITLDTTWADVVNSRNATVDGHNKGKVVLPVGKGIAGLVAQTREPICIYKNAYADARFDKSVDAQTGFHTHCVLCYPIISADGRLIGVAQIINKRRDSHTAAGAQQTFTAADEAIFAQYLVFCGIGLQNAQLFQLSIQEYGRNQQLLLLARSIFCEQLSIERMVCQIMQQSKMLVPCDCCWIMLLEQVLHSSASIHQQYAQFDKRRMSAASVWSLKQQFDEANRRHHTGKHQQYQVGEKTFVAVDCAIPTGKLWTLVDIQFSEAYALPNNTSESEISTPSSPAPQVITVSSTDLEDSWVLELGRAVVMLRRPIRMDKDSIENQSQTLAQHLQKNIVKQKISTHSSNDDNVEDERKEIAEEEKTSTAANSTTTATAKSLEIHAKHSTATTALVPTAADEKNYLAVPVFDAQHRVVATIIMEARHEHDEFGTSDMQMMEAFAIFCGLGITNAQLYEKALHWCARQQVALEVISYHAMASQSEVEQLAAMRPELATHWNLYSYQFDDATLKSEQITLQASLAIFADLNLVAQFNIEHVTLCRWLCSVKKNYRPVKYHNWRHAFNVAQTMFAVLTQGGMNLLFDPLTIFGLMVAAFCHDLDHRGTNNAFQSLAGTGLAVLYGSSVMEHHHFNQCMLLLSAPNNNIFQSLTTMQYKTIVEILERCILATDLAMFFRKKGDFTRMSDEYHAKFRALEEQASSQQQENDSQAAAVEIIKKQQLFLRSSSTISSSALLMQRQRRTSSIKSQQQTSQHRLSTESTAPFLYWRDSAAANTLLSSMLMTACDVSAISKPWPIQKHVAQVVYDEFFDQGDMEKQAFGKISSDMLDRGKRADLPNMQVKFIDSVCEPLYRILSSMFAGIAPLLNGCIVNRDHWIHETSLHVRDAGA